jgi:hypothetical protein
MAAAGAVAIVVAAALSGGPASGRAERRSAIASR